MRRSEIAAAILAGLALLVLSGCGKEYRSTSQPGTASSTVKTLIKAVEDDDIDAYLSVLPAEIRAVSEQSRQMLGAKFDEVMSKQLATNRKQVEGARVTGEKIDGDTAKVTLTSGSGEPITFDLVREGDEWKLDLDMK